MPTRAGMSGKQRAGAQVLPTIEQRPSRQPMPVASRYADDRRVNVRFARVCDPLPLVAAERAFSCDAPQFTLRAYLVLLAAVLKRRP